MSELQLRPDIWSDLILIVKSKITHFSSRQHNDTGLVTAFTGLVPSKLITIFMRYDEATLLSVRDAQIKRSVNKQKLIYHVDELRLIVCNAVTENRKRAREHVFKGC